jgi:hypothetical protein
MIGFLDIAARCVPTSSSYLTCVPFPARGIADIPVRDTGTAALDAKLLSTLGETAVAYARQRQLESSSFDVDEMLLRWVAISLLLLLLLLLLLRLLLLQINLHLVVAFPSPSPLHHFVGSSLHHFVISSSRRLLPFSLSSAAPPSIASSGRIATSPHHLVDATAHHETLLQSEARSAVSTIRAPIHGIRLSAILTPRRVKALLGLNALEEDQDLDEDELEGSDPASRRRHGAAGGPLGNWEKLGWMAAGLTRRVPGMEFM